MRWFAGVALRGTNSVIVVSDERDQVLDQKQLRTELPPIFTALEPYWVIE